MGLLLGVQLQGYAASRSNALQHREGMAGVLGILKTGNHGLRCTRLLSKLSLSQARVLAHFADQHGQVNLVQGAREGLTVGDALTCALLDNFSMSVAFHSSNSSWMASLSLCDPV